MSSTAENPWPDNGSAPRPRPRTSPLVMGLILIGCIALPAYFWKGTWFGTRLSDAQLREYLADRDKPRHVQHALVQLTERIERDPAAAGAFHEAMVALVDHPREEVRSTLAWAMGWDNSVNAFHQALRRLLADEAPLVRRNAALSLSKFGDSACRGELLAMLAPFEVTAPIAGKLSDLPPEGRAVKVHSHLATITPAGGKVQKAYAPLDGRILNITKGNGDAVAAGEGYCTLTPGEADMWEALRALALAGKPEDVAAIRSALGRSYTSQRAAQQGEMTIKLIENRAGS